MSSHRTPPAPAQLIPRAGGGRFHAYDTTALQEGWDCAYCGAALEQGGVHYVTPKATPFAFCRPECGDEHARRESRRATSNPRQVGMAL